ncbi:MAG: class I SAM-dependent methyltransferase [Candidatus Dormibacteria bacterium]
MELDTTDGPLRTSLHPDEQGTQILPLKDRLPASVLIVGGGSHESYPRLHRGEISLDIAVHARPDVYGTITGAPFRDKTFARIIFQWLPTALWRTSSVLQEARRILRKGGELRIETSANAVPWDLVDLLEECGFSEVRVVSLGRSDLPHGVAVIALRAK